jgi:hypothetical protein
MQVCYTQGRSIGCSDIVLPLKNSSAYEVKCVLNAYVRHWWPH